MGLFKYLHAAFTQRWNLLAFLGTLAFAAVGPRPDVTMPLVFAAEVAYVGLLGTHPKFRKYVDAQEAKTTREQGSASAQAVMERILGRLPDELAQRFEDLRSRCRELRGLAAELRHPERVGTPQPLDELQLAGLDKLLWIYLRLLFTQHSLERFLHKTNDRQIRGDLEKLEERLAGIPADDASAQRQRMRKAIEDNLETTRSRLSNFEKARDNLQFVQLEIERLENKIRTISEMAVNRQEPEFISGQVDEVATSMVQTERTMSELDFLTGLNAADEAVPRMMQRETVTAKQ